MENKEDQHEPSKLPYELLKQITDDFAEERILGKGAYGTVYKGMHGKEIAVKVLNNSAELDDEEFSKEFGRLKRLKHKNIVKLVGFCSEEKEELAEFFGKQVATTRTHRALCFEYVENGSLDKLIFEKHKSLNWHTSYNIITGICEGLKYLHEEFEHPMYHLDLKPSNILLDVNMIPKIADFGLSKFLGEETTRKAMQPVGTCGYWPPEYTKHQIISTKSDIFSLGVIIIELIAGHDGYQPIADMTNQKFHNHVYGNWKRRLPRTMSPRSVEVYSNQVKKCIDIALDCVKSNRQERPTIQDIISSLNKTEIMYYGDDGDSTQPSRISITTIDSRPSSSSLACRESSIGTPRLADDSKFSRSSSTESKAHHEPHKLPYQLLKRITNNFHKDLILGRGGFGTVYKGVHENGDEIAVKVLHNSTGLDDKEFRKEFNNLKRLKHQNVVELVGYCSEEEDELVEIQGKQVPAVRIRLALCFEYVHNGSLEKYISDESMQFDWPARYKIINGICEGLEYLHENLIIHCDLKPGNILLDKNKMAKIADFGLAKLFGEENTKKTMSSLGTCGYQPPEFIDRQIISREFDIYSLGVIIVKIMTGHEGYNSGLGTITPNSVNLVYESWMKKLPETSNHKLCGRQVKTCIGIAIDCLKTNRHERPTIGEIVSRLKKQYYQYEGESTQCSRITVDSVPSSGHGEASGIATHTENFWGVGPRVNMTPLHGSCLDRYISDISTGLDWRTRYRIQKGICDGVKHLHEGSSSPIIHMNLKTSNILLDDKMLPKLGDFVMTKLTGEENSTKTMSMTGTIEHMPPEFIEQQVISKEFDIYSLGVLFIKVMAGQRLYSEHLHMSSMDFIELAHSKWRKRLQKTMCLKSAEGCCKQVRKCLEIAFKCMEADRRKRPTIGDIIRALSETETMTPPEQINLDLINLELLIEDHPMELLIDVQPLELCFKFMSSLKLPRKKDISCLLQLKNRGNDRVAFMLVANNTKNFLTKKPLCGVVPQGSTYILTLIMPKQPQSSHGDDFFTLYTVAVDGYDLRDVHKGSIANEYGNFFKKAKETAYQEVQEVILKVLCCQEDNDQGTSSAEPTLPAVEIVTTPDAQQVSSIDVHPEEPWILTTSRVGRLHVWDYRTMTPLNSFELAAYEPVHAAKFIARAKWLLAGDSSGGIHVYSYDENKHVNSFDAHDSRITTLAVHPTRSLILSSSSEDDDRLIKLWDWGSGWECTRTFQGHTDRVTQVTFNPEVEDSFASASWDGTVKIWSIVSDDPSQIITLNLDRYAVESLLCLDYFTRRDRQHLIVGCRNRTAQIWNLCFQGCVHEVEGHADRITAVNLHPRLPVLITASLDGTVCIWNSNTYKLQTTIGFNLGAVYAFGCIKGSTRIVVGCDQGIATMEISSP